MSIYNNNNKVIVAMSGGVDSSVTAALLKESGYKIDALFMKNWEEDDADECISKKDYEDAKRLCKKLGIKMHLVNFSDSYWNLVFKTFLNGLKNGITPNPDIFCNKEIKFKQFLKYGLSLGCDKVATGHYAKINIVNNCYTLNKPLDKIKDQTYFLYMLNQNILKNLLFPLSDINKDDVKKIAKSLDIEISRKKESMGICFIGKKKFSDFIKKYIKPNPGLICDANNMILGNHDGLFNYTIGQRKGINIGGKKNYLNKPWFVSEKDIKNNKLIISQDENDLLFKGNIILDDVNWISKNIKKENLSCKARLRHGGQLIDCAITNIDNRYILKLNDHERAVTLGQSAVLYTKNQCLGGGIIKQKCLASI
ncbi:MAG: tRNA 2-thiouridine(34) synthase MnmA [Gammaproteobacteria bacterium]|nr:tRNA 2-thiouridine(34) synthase MnmA [Gammaproteobacteria bacterium]